MFFPSDTWAAGVAPMAGAILFAAAALLVLGTCGLILGHLVQGILLLVRRPPEGAEGQRGSLVFHMLASMFETAFFGLVILIFTLVPGLVLVAALVYFPIPTTVILLVLFVLFPFVVKPLNRRVGRRLGKDISGAVEAADGAPKP